MRRETGRGRVYGRIMTTKVGQIRKIYDCDVESLTFLLHFSRWDKLRGNLFLKEKSESF